MNGDRITTALPLILVAMLAIFTFWLDRLAQPVPKGISGTSRHDPDYIVEGLTAMRMNTTGATAYTLSSRKMEHYPDDDTTLLTAPRLVSLEPGKAPITITARRALVSSNGQNVYFEDDVQLTRTAIGDSSEMQMNTTYLHVIPDDRVAETDRPVVLTDAATTVNAAGLELNSETRILKLRGRVHGTYDPNKAPRRGQDR